MDYYNYFNSLLGKDKTNTEFFINRFSYILINLYNFVPSDELSLVDNPLVYTFEHNIKAIIYILSQFIPIEDRKHLWLYDWNNTIFLNQLYDSLYNLNHKHLILWFFLHCNYYLKEDYNSKISKLNNNMDFIVQKGLLFNSINDLYRNTYGVNLLPFYALSYMDQNNKDIFIRRCEFYKKICPDLIYNSVNDRKINTIGKLKIGFISDFLAKDSSVLRDRMGIIDNLSSDKYDISLLIFNNKENISGLVAKKFYEKHIANYIHLPVDFNKARDEIADLNLDILVFCEIGMDIKNFLLSFSRLAPVQVNTWGHSDTSGIDTIDYYITSKYFEDSDANNNYSEKMVLFDSLSTYYYKPSELLWDDYEIVTRKNFNIDDSVTVYGCIQTSFKISDKFEEIMATILERDSNSIIILSNIIPFCKSHIQRMKDKMGDNYQRVKIFQSLKGDIYLNLISLCDILLDPYPFGGCNTSFEAFEFNIPVITYPSKFLNGRFTQGLYKKMGFSQLVAYSVDNYIEIALKYGMNKDKLHEISGLINDNKSKIFKEEASVTDWDNFFTNCKE